jgi:hypothetical protein
MATPIGERAISDAVRVGNAILKFISANDVGRTGGHQCGYYLPKAVWEVFTEHPPTKGRNDESEVEIQWQDGRVTDSRVKWYGRGTRSEYRLTRFGKDFPFLTHDNVGDLIVLIPEDHHHFLAYVLDLEDDIEEIQAALGVEITVSWAAYRNGQPLIEPEDEEECIDRRFRHFAEALRDFPSGEVFSQEARAALQECIRMFPTFPADEALIRCMDAEYRLFRLAERQISGPEIQRLFRDVDDFLGTASRIMNRRKARAGRSLENHVDWVLTRANIPHIMRPNVDGRPDVLIPSIEAYRDSSYPLDRLFAVGVKTTCKDRWRQVLNEARRVRHKHIITIQQGISANQLAEMHEANVTLVVPRDIQRQYPRGGDIEMQNIEQFIETVRRRIIQ